MKNQNDVLTRVKTLEAWLSVLADELKDLRLTLESMPAIPLPAAPAAPAAGRQRSYSHASVKREYKRRARWITARPAAPARPLKPVYLYRL